MVSKSRSLWSKLASNERAICAIELLRTVSPFPRRSDNLGLVVRLRSVAKKRVGREIGPEHIDGLGEDLESTAL